MYIGLHVKYKLSLSDFNKTCFFTRQIWENSSSMKFHENPSIARRVASRGQTDGHSNTTKVMVAFRYFVNAPKTINEGI
jgi:hypothetical protein